MFCKAIALPSLNLQLIPLLVGMTWDFTIEPFSGTLKSSHFLDGTYKSDMQFFGHSTFYISSSK